MLERTEVGFDPIVYHVTEGGIAILRVVLNIAYMDQIMVSLQSNEGSATGNFQVIGYIICEIIHSGKSLSLVSLKRDFKPRSSKGYSQVFCMVHIHYRCG